MASAFPGRLALGYRGDVVPRRARVPFVACGACLLLACGSRSEIFAPGSGAGVTSSGQPYACATRGATYVLDYDAVTVPGCGPVPSQTIDVGTDGSVASDMTACANVDAVGCTTTGSGCLSRRNFPGPPVTSVAGSCTSGYSITFSSDGFVVNGQATIHCVADGYSCEGSYSVTGRRQ